MNRVPSSRVITRSAICSSDWPLDRLAAVVAVRLADPRPEQAQVVVDLGDGADRRARVARGGLLVDRDRRREPLDGVDVGLLHLAEELPRVGRERLDVAALPLGVDRVEGEARLARAGEPGDDDQRVAGQLEVDALEVVLAGAGDDDLTRTCHSRRILGVEQAFPKRLRRAAPRMSARAPVTAAARATKTPAATSRSPARRWPPLTMEPPNASPRPALTTVAVISHANASLEFPLGATRSASAYSMAEQGASVNPANISSHAIEGMDHAQTRADTRTPAGRWQRCSGAPGAFQDRAPYQTPPTRLATD